MKPYLYASFLIMAFCGCTNSAGTKQLNPEETKNDTTQLIVPISINLPTEFFEVTLQRFWVLKRVNTGNEFTSLPKQIGIKYLVLRLKYKNTDNESRIIGPGQVYINYKGKEYNFDHSETILGPHWGTGMEQLNPLTSETLVFVFKLPDEIRGIAYFHPGRTDDRHFIEIGNIK